MNRGSANYISCRGFTLIELMVVLVLIAIATAMIIPEMKGTFEGEILRSTARKVMSVCEVAHSRAISKNQRHRVRLNRSEGSFMIEATAPEGSGFVALNDEPGAKGEIDKRITIELRKGGEPLDASQQSRDRAPDLIVFYPDGTADAAEMTFQDRAGFRLALQINPITGRIRLSQPDQD